MAKIIQTVTNIIFDDLEELTKAALKYLKRRWTNDSITEFSEFVGSIVAEQLTLAKQGRSMVSEVENLDSAIIDVGLDLIAVGEGAGYKCRLDYAIAIINAGGAVEFASNCFNMYNITTLDERFESTNVGFLGNIDFEYLMLRVIAGEFALDINDAPARVVSHATRQRSDASLTADLGDQHA